MTKEHIRKAHRDRRGQGLTEYALILTLVAVVIVTILALLGPQIGNVYAQVNYPLGYRPPSPLVAMTAVRFGMEGNDVEAILEVSVDLNVTFTDSQSGQSQSLSCSGTCQVIFLAVGHSEGTVTATSAEHSLSAGYPPKF